MSAAQRASSAAALLLAVLPAQALDWGRESLQRYGGTYAVACGDPAALHLVVDAAGLLAERGKRRLQGGLPQVSLAFFGASTPPPGFLAALQSETADGHELLLLIYRDTLGRYASFETDPTLLAALGTTADDSIRYRDCDPARRASEGAAARRDQRQERADERARARASPLADPRFKAAYARALGSKAGVPWLARLDGPAQPPERLALADGDFVRYAVCKAHDCGDNNLVLLYSEARGAVYGQLFEDGRRTTWLGAPPPRIAAELERQWQAVWRSGR